MLKIIIIITFNIFFVTCIDFKYLNESVNKICETKYVSSNSTINSNIAICLNNSTKFCITMFNDTKIYIHTPKHKPKILIDNEVLYFTFNMLPVFCFNNDIYLLNNDIYIFDKNDTIFKKINDLKIYSKVNINTTTINYNNFGFIVEYKNNTHYYCKYSNKFINYFITKFKKPINEIQLKDIVKKDFLIKKNDNKNNTHLLKLLKFVFIFSLILILLILIIKKVKA